MSSDGENHSTRDPQTDNQEKASITPEILLETRQKLRRPSNFADPTVTANLEKTKHLNVATVDLNVIDRADSLSTSSMTQEVKSSFPKVLRELKRFPASESKALLLGTDTSKRGRFLSLDSLNIFQSRSKDRNRRCSWYGGSIRTSLIRTEPKSTRRCSKISVGTVDSDGYAVRCGVKKVIQVDVHRSLTGEPACSAAKKSPQFKPRKSPESVIISIDTPEGIDQNSQDSSRFDHYQTRKSDESMCIRWLRGIDKMMSFCPSCSEQVGPVLITVSLCAGLIIVATVLVFFTWIVTKLGFWWT